MAQFAKVTGLYKVFNVDTTDPTRLDTTTLKTEISEKVLQTSILYIVATEEDETYGYAEGTTYTWGNGVLVGQSNNLANLILLNYDAIANDLDSSTGEYGETIITGETTTEEDFYTFIDEDNTDITADEYFEKLANSCVYLATTQDDQVNLKMGVNNMVNMDDGTITLTLHSHIHAWELETYDGVFVLDFNNKVASITLTQWSGDEMHAAKPIMIEVAMSIEEVNDESILTYQLKRDGKNISSKEIYELEQAGYRITYYSIHQVNDKEVKRIIMFTRAEGSDVESRVNLYCIETDSHNTSYYMPSLTYYNFSTSGTIVYNETKDICTTGKIELIHIIREVINTDTYLNVSTNKSVYEVNVNVVEIDNAIEALTVPAFANVTVANGAIETPYENMLCAGAVEAFHGGKEYYYFMLEGVSFCVKTEEILNGNALITNTPVLTYEWDSTNKVMNPVAGTTLTVTSFTYLDQTVALADVLDVKRHLATKQDASTAATKSDLEGMVKSVNGITPDEDGDVDITDSSFIKYYATMADYTADTTRSEVTCVSYIEDMDKIIYDHDGFTPAN